MIGFGDLPDQACLPHNVSEFSNAEPETDQGEGSANPGHEGAISRLPATLFG